MQLVKEWAVVVSRFSDEDRADGEVDGEAGGRLVFAELVLEVALVVVGEGAESVTVEQLIALDLEQAKVELVDHCVVMHREGAKMLVDGRRTRSDIKMNPGLDKQFADILCHGEANALDHWSNTDLIEQGGIGFTELHTWVAAMAVFRTLCPDQQAVFEMYSETLEYGIGFGALSGGFSVGELT